MDDNSRRDQNGISGTSSRMDSEARMKAAERRAAMLRGLSLAHVALGRELPVKEAMDVMIGAYMEILQPVATRHLPRCFQQAIQNHTSMSTMVGANEVLAAYRRLAEGGAFRYQENPLKMLEGPRMSREEISEAIRDLRAKVWPDGPPDKSRVAASAGTVANEVLQQLDNAGGHDADALWCYDDADALDLGPGESDE